MKAYFTASVVGKKYYLKKYLQIIAYLKSKKIQLISEHIINVTEDQIRISKKSDRLKFHNQLHEWINSADFMIVEASFPSISVGYEISLALRSRKPVLVLFSEGDPPSLIQDFPDEKLICEKYTSNNLNSIIDNFLLYVKGVQDLRFTFFISPKIALFLEKISQSKKIPKSVYLRNLIEADQNKNKI